jgi:hypothetical protein
MTMIFITQSPRRSLLLVGMAASLFLTYGTGSSAGIQGSGRFAVTAFGRITAFGSIFVNGVEYEISQAQIKLDGKAAKASQLEVGQIVAVQGVLDGSGKGTANRISYTSNVVGPVSQVDVAGNSFTVLGQQVQVDASTSFGEGLQSAGIGGLQQGLAIVVSGFTDAAGNVLASRIDLALGALLQVKGTVQTLDVAAHTFRINGLVIDYSGSVPSGKLLNGGTATVQAAESPANGTLHATLVQLSSGVGGVTNTQGQMEGLITSVSSDGEFFVGDQEIVTDSATHFVLHGQTLAPDLSVKVIGAFAPSGALVAKSVMTHPSTGH